MAIHLAARETGSSIISHPQRLPPASCLSNGRIMSVLTSGKEGVNQKAIRLAGRRQECGSQGLSKDLQCYKRDFQFECYSSNSLVESVPCLQEHCCSPVDRQAVAGSTAQHGDDNGDQIFLVSLRHKSARISREKEREARRMKKGWRIEQGTRRVAAENMEENNRISFAKRA